jgi:hypothetical protein
MEMITLNEEIIFLNYLSSSEKILKDILKICAKIKAFIKGTKYNNFEIWNLHQSLYNLRDLLSIHLQKIDDISYNNFSEIKYTLRNIIYACLDILEEIIKNDKYNPKELEKKLDLTIKITLKTYSDTKKKHKVHQYC